MALKLPPPIIQKVQGLRALQYKDSNLLLWDTPCILIPVQMEAYKNLICDTALDGKYKTLHYLTAKLQAKTGVKIINERFGYAETLLDKRKLLEFNMGQFELLGHGKVDILKADFENLDFLFKTNSTYAQEYKSMFGIQKKPVDITMAGMSAGCLEQITGKQLFCLETRCVAKGDTVCEFIIKPLNKWNKKEIVDFKDFLNKDYEKKLMTKWKILTK